MRFFARQKPGQCAAPAPAAAFLVPAPGNLLNHLLQAGSVAGIAGLTFLSFTAVRNMPGPLRHVARIAAVLVDAAACGRHAP